MNLFAYSSEDERDINYLLAEPVSLTKEDDRNLHHYQQADVVIAVCKR